MTLVKYVFVQNDPFFLPRVLDTYLQEFAETTAGVNIQSVAQGKRSMFETALDLYRMYGFGYFQWKLRRYLLRKVPAKVVTWLLGRTGTCYAVAAAARKPGVEGTGDGAVNVQSRVQMDLFKARQKATTEFDELLEKTGLSHEEALKRVASSGRARALYYPPHVDGVAGTGANHLMQLIKH